MAKEAALKPCPWGAGHALAVRDSAGTVYWIECATDDCGVVGPRRLTRGSAVAAWNRRSS